MYPLELRIREDVENSLYSLFIFDPNSENKQNVIESADFVTVLETLDRYHDDFAGRFVIRDRFTKDMLRRFKTGQI